MIYKTIICLANSPKPGGRCIAGKEYSNGVIGPWLRPVEASDPKDGISWPLKSITPLETLDIIELRVVSEEPVEDPEIPHQVENRAIAEVGMEIAGKTRGGRNTRYSGGMPG